MEETHKCDVDWKEQDIKECVHLCKIQKWVIHNILFRHACMVCKIIKKSK